MDPVLDSVVDPVLDPVLDPRAMLAVFSPVMI